MTVAQVRKWRRIVRPTFSLKALFVVITIASAWCAVSVRRAREQQAAAQLIVEQNGGVYYDFQERPPGSGRFDTKARSSVPAWLSAYFGEDFFSDIVFARIGNHLMRDEEHTIPVSSPQSAVRRLAGLRNLRRLDFDDGRLTDETLKYVGELRHLESLFVSSDASEVTDAGISHLRGLRKLKHLSLDGAAITDASLKTLAALHSLQHLGLERTRISDLGLVHLRGLTELETLDLGHGSGRITDAGIACLGGLSRLESLDLSDARLTAAGLAQLRPLRRLRMLTLSNNRELGDEAMQHVAAFGLLEELRLDNTNITSKGMRCLKRLSKLRFLDLSGNGGITEEGAACLSHLTSLEELRLRNTKVSSSGVAGWRRLRRLQWLDLSNNSNIDESVAPHLARVTALRELNLHHTHVKLDQANAGVLASLASLEYLDLAESGSDCAAVQAVLPRCSVAGSRTHARMSSFSDEGEDFTSVMQEDFTWVMREFVFQYAFKIDLLSAPPDAGSKGRQHVPSPNLFPPTRTLERMLALSADPGAAAVMRTVRPAVEEYAAASFRQASHDASAEDSARKLLDFARSSASLVNLYAAALDLEFADRFSAHLEYLEGVRFESGLTDVETREYQQVSEYRQRCLDDAMRELALPPEAASDISARLRKDSQRHAARSERPD